jgi:hypothetical protein
MNKDPLFIDRAPRPTRPRLVPAPRPRPLWLDFFLILLGCAVSLLLTEISGLHAHATSETPAEVRLLLPLLPRLLLLPVGILLFWPLFYLTQKIAGRKQPLSAGEWLWGVAWLGAVTLTVWICWQAWGTPPEALRPENFAKQVFVGYAVGVLALASFALIIGLVDMIGRWGQPWTHHLCLALLMWPQLPLLALLLWKIEIKQAAPSPPTPLPRVQGRGGAG